MALSSDGLAIIKGVPRKNDENETYRKTLAIQSSYGILKTRKDRSFHGVCPKSEALNAVKLLQSLDSGDCSRVRKASDSALES